MKLKTLPALFAGAALIAPMLASAACFQEAQPWTVRAGVHNIDPSGGTSTVANGAIKVDVESKLGPTVNLDYRFCHNFTLDVMGALPFTQDIKLNGNRLGSTRHLPPTVSVQFHPIPDGTLDPFVGVGLNRTFFFNESLNGPLAGNNLQLSNTWGYALQGGLDWKFAPNWLVGVDLRYIQIEPKASLNGAPIGTVKIDPLAYGITVGYKF
ncbi:MAG: OmpW family outer membrane protein [Nevskia sp.]|nr:OmpW family outer membrane protein [Nevskia sp.]